MNVLRDLGRIAARLAVCCLLAVILFAACRLAKAGDLRPSERSRLRALAAGTVTAGSISGSEIGAGAISNANVAAGAGIAASKLALAPYNVAGFTNGNMRVQQLTNAIATAAGQWVTNHIIATNGVNHTIILRPLAGKYIIQSWTHSP